MTEKDAVDDESEVLLFNWFIAIAESILKVKFSFFETTISIMDCVDIEWRNRRFCSIEIPFER